MLKISWQTPARISKVKLRFAFCLLAFAFVLILAAQPPAALAASTIKVLVNNQPITTNDIARRAAFFKLRRVKGNHTKLATDELIDEAIKMQEAKRINAVASQKEVDEAYVRFSQNNKIPLKALEQIMARSGVTVRGFKQYIRAQISWQRAVAARFRAQGGSASSNDRRNRSAPYLPPIGESENLTQVKEYTLQQIVFVVPKGKSKSVYEQRKREARNFRSRFNGCDSAVGFAKGLRDVSVLDRGRVRENELPDRWRRDVAETPVGKTTAPKQTEKGIELLAVCRSRNVKGQAVKEAIDLNREAGELDKKYLDELKESAKIVRR